MEDYMNTTNSNKSKYQEESVIPGVLFAVVGAILILIVGKLFLNRVDAEIAQYNPAKETKVSKTENVQVKTASLKTSNPVKE